MAEMDEHDFADMVEQTPVDTYIDRISRASAGGQPGRLIGACLSDQQSDGLRMIYSFFDVGPDARKGLGTYIILDHISRARAPVCPTSISAIGSRGRSGCSTRPLPPLERLGRDGWRRMEEIESEPERAIRLPKRIRRMERPA